MIKIDVEGFEMKVLRGGGKTLKTFKPSLFIELDDNNLKDVGSCAKDLVKFLRIRNLPTLMTMKRRLEKKMIG